MTVNYSPYHIIKTPDEGYFFTCIEHHNSGLITFYEKMTIIKTDSLGNEEFRFQLANPDYFTTPGWVVPTDDGNYITAYADPLIITDNNPDINFNKTIWIEQFDIEGNNLFTISLYNFLPLIFTGSGYSYSISQMLLSDNGDIIIVGSIPFNIGFILSLTQDGEPNWFRFIEPPQALGNDAGGEFTKVLGITPTSDGGYILAGQYFSSPGNLWPNGIATAFAAKLDEIGCLEPVCQLADAIDEEVLNDFNFQVFPNPARDKIRISFFKELSEPFELVIYSITGEALLLNPSTRSGRHEYDINSLSPGMYIIQVELENGYRSARKFVKE